jgi:hypothetical protein
MFYRFNFFEDRALLKVMIYGQADQQSMRSRLALLVNDHRWKSEYKLLIDYSGVTVIDTPEEFTNSLRELLNEIPEERLPVGIAYVFPDRLFCQCFDPGHAVYSLEAKCKVCFFRQEKAAIDWLEKLAIECMTAKEDP